MKIIAHRGLWNNPKEQNTSGAFLRALDHGWGIEFDVRDRDQKAVISHDMPSAKSAGLREVLQKISGHPNFKESVYAINIKSDGLEEELCRVVAEFEILENSFVFDMSVPSMSVFCGRFSGKINFATRQSDIEQSPVFYKFSKWVWMDELVKPWISRQAIMRHLRNHKSLCLVSSELHQRPHLKSWRLYASLSRQALDKIALCTDNALEAEYFFNRSAKYDKSRNL